MSKRCEITGISLSKNQIEYCKKKAADLNLENQVKRASILPEAKHSDHCPILLEVDF